MFSKSLLVISNAFLINSLYAQTIFGNLSLSANKEIKLYGYEGLKTYLISTSHSDDKGNFKLVFSKTNYGIGYLISENNKPKFIILNGQNIDLKGKTLDSAKISSNKENYLFQNYTNQHPFREQLLNTWMYLEKVYTQDTTLAIQSNTIKAICREKIRLNNESTNFLLSLPNDSYIRWFLPLRNLINSVSNIVHYRTEEIPETIAAIRSLDFTDSRLQRSGLLKDAIESHFWVLENCGKNSDSIFVLMRTSIDCIMGSLRRNEKLLNEVTYYLFNLLERHSFFQASEYLALKLLNDKQCILDTNVSNQLESYRAMKKGEIAPEINLSSNTYINGFQQTSFNNLASFKTPYTIVFFGASWCTRCTEELPRAIQAYVKWRNLGIEVLYISLDTDSTAFKNDIKKYPFFAYCDFKKWESPIVKEYYVYGTPTFYLLDNKRRIILRPSSILQIDAWVDWFLVKGNRK